MSMSRLGRAQFLLPRNLLNGILFNVSWLLIVTSESSLVAPCIVALHLLLHFVLVGLSRPELKVILLVSVFGFVLDNLLFRLGVFQLAGPGHAPPLWLTSLWPVLATTLMHAFSALQGRVLLAGLFGAVGGALSYSAGTSLTAVAFFDPVWGPVVLGLLWAFLFPSLLLVAAQIADQGRESDDVVV